MSEVVPTPVAPPPVPAGYVAPQPLPKAPSKTVAWLKKAVAAVATVVTSSSAVTAEKSLGVLIVTGVLTSLGAGYGAVELATRIIQGL
jgi:hypothetical protein